MKTNRTSRPSLIQQLVTKRDYLSRRIEARLQATNPDTIIERDALIKDLVAVNASIEHIVNLRHAEALRIEAERRIQQQSDETQTVVMSGICPLCGSGLRRNSALDGWWQCEQFGSDGFRKDNSKPSCSWQGFISRPFSTLKQAEQAEVELKQAARKLKRQEEDAARRMAEAESDARLEDAIRHELPSIIDNVKLNVTVGLRAELLHGFPVRLCGDLRIECHVYAMNSWDFLEANTPVHYGVNWAAMGTTSPLNTMEYAQLLHAASQLAILTESVVNRLRCC